MNFQMETLIKYFLISGIVLDLHMLGMQRQVLLDIFSAETSRKRVRKIRKMQTFKARILFSYAFEFLNKYKRDFHIYRIIHFLHAILFLPILIVELIIVNLFGYSEFVAIILGVHMLIRIILGTNLLYVSNWKYVKADPLELLKKRTKK